MIDGKRERARAQRAERHAYETSVAPRGLGAWLARHGVKADLITALGIALAALTALAIGLGWLWAAVVLLTTGGLMDTLDGSVAKAAGSASARGAFFDSVSDRIADGLIFGGLAFYFLDGRDPKLALLPIAIFGVAALVSYERAKAELLGFSARGGLMERAERLILLGVALLIHVVLVPLLIVLLVLTSFTAVGRFVRVWRQASGEPQQQSARSDIWRAELDARWKAWRATTRARTRQRNRREVAPLTTRLRGVLAGQSAASVKDKRQRRALRTYRRRSSRIVN